MPRTASSPRKRNNTVTVRLEAAGAAAGVAPEEGGEEVSFSGAPLFAQAPGSEQQIDRISISRTEPLDEGHLGYLEPDASEEDIVRRFGGGTFRLQARSRGNQMVANGFRTVKLAGDPIFGSALSLARWNRMRRQEAAIDGEAEPGRRRELSMVELLELQERKEETRRLRDKEETDRREREREQNHVRELERLRIEAQLREDQRRADDERRERDRAAADERQVRDQEAARARDREFYAQMLSVQQSNAKGDNFGKMLEQLAMARELFGGGDGGGDPVTALVQNLPQILGAGSNVAAQLEAKPAPAARPPKGPHLTLTGVHAVQLQATVDHLRAEGIDPDATFLRMLNAMRSLRGEKGKAKEGPAQQGADGAQGAGEQPPAAEPSPAAARVRRGPAHRARR